MQEMRGIGLRAYARIVPNTLYNSTTLTLNPKIPKPKTQRSCRRPSFGINKPFSMRLYGGVAEAI